MRIIGAKVFDPDGFRNRDLYIENGRVVLEPQAGNRKEEEPDCQDQEVIHAEGLYAIPGLVDLHFHGAVGCDLCDAAVESIEKIAAYEAAHGITTICPATMTCSREKLMDIMRAAGAYHKKIRSRNTKNGKGPYARLAGIHLEGPFINVANAGAQNPSYVVEADLRMLQALQEESGDLIRLVTLAPECGNNLDFIRQMREKYPQVRCSLGHTACDYTTARRAFEQGADHLTHLFNAMPGLHHRNPGPVSAGMESSAYAEIIADGIHVHPSMVRLAFRLFGPERMILISDSMRACGLKDGIYELGGQNVRVQGRKAVLAENPNTIAGSVTNLYDCLKIAVKEMKIPLHDAVRAATYNPARSIGLDGEVGNFLPGRRGDVLLLDADLTLVRMICSPENAP